MKRIFITALVFIFVSAAAACAAAPWSPKAGEYWIKINKQQLRLTLFKGGEVVKSWPVSVGKGRGKTKTSRMDLITPTGTFTIYRVIPDATKLVFDPAWFNEPGEAAPGAYGSKLISFYNKWQIAIRHEQPRLCRALGDARLRQTQESRYRGSRDLCQAEDAGRDR